MKGLTSTPAMEKSYRLGLKIVKLYSHLNETYKMYDLSRQLLRSGTSVGANVAEAQGGMSTADFSAKIGIAYKEALETKYWINLLHDSAMLDVATFEDMFESCDEVCRILFSILKKTRYAPGTAEEDFAEYGPD